MIGVIRHLAFFLMLLSSVSMYSPAFRHGECQLQTCYPFDAAVTNQTFLAKCKLVEGTELVGELS